MGWLSLSLSTLICSLLSRTAHGYIPAVASNATEGSGLDVHDNSKVSLTWDPDGSYSTVVSYQQAGNTSLGISQGALIKVKEEDFWMNDTTSTPWIALISCDQNATNATMDNDIFTMVRDRGAVAALLYSNTSDGCLLNPEYHYGDDFSQIFDIFTSKKAANSILIQSQFTNVKGSYQTYNPKLLNDSAGTIQTAISNGTNTSPYIVATLRAANATGPEVSSGGISQTPTTTQANHDEPSQSLAMIILYVIVSLVAALFIIVIVSGAVRAFRHPERYGPRLYDPTLDGEDGQPQTRAGGITRAILDTFPVIKWGRDGGSHHYNANDHLQRHELKQTDIETYHASNRELLLSSQSSNSALADSRLAPSPSPYSVSDAGHSNQNPISISSVVGAKSVRTSTETNTLDPAAIGKETCPICIVDFEEGDDIRVLPCEGKHRFHKDCVDLWLLELSSSCPICREDFQALEIMVAGTEGFRDQEEEDNDSIAPVSVTSSSRFSRYLRFAQKRRRSRREPPAQPETSTSASKSSSPIPPTDH
ncbi:hypothetical protein FRC18_007281 [Serendipita sp. 400]|nr:hypothetical protein FRC18_007281 [Serendipita sp. 400]